MNDGRFVLVRYPLDSSASFLYLFREMRMMERDRWQNGTLDETERNLAEASWASFAHKRIYNAYYIYYIDKP